MGIRVLHTGDLHIGSFSGPEHNGENARYIDICRCLDALAEKAKEEKPDIAVIAGDVFHQAKVWSDRGLKEQQTAVRFFRELEKICPVIVMRGTPNHDSEEQFRTLKNTFENDGNIHIVTEPSVETFHSYSGEKIQIACMPGFDRGYFRAKNPGLSKEEENEVFTKTIEDIIIGLKAQCNNNSPTVLVSHYTIAGCNMESGQTAFFSQFEPIVYPSTLTIADFDLVCFGHIHRPQQIEGCKNTFYCGAISQLNFNDEGQQRGFYIHDIGGGSTFYELPTREYYTLRLNDDDVREINENGAYRINKLPLMNEEGKLRDKVVRVIYNCTDEHNKAFNHAELERWLYDTAGAFWVQEITPQKISITVDRNSMDADSTPESNLSDYLAEKNFEPEKIGELIELAGQIISTATEKATTERRTGLFVPVEIEVKNYRNYRYEKFSFEDVHFCTINGSNGVGKSSLFMDAMADALFEETREGELTGWICNDADARSGSIKFTFKLGEALYRVTRTRQKSGKATLNISELADGEWIDRSKEKFKDTQAEIINIIGMDSLTLKACALIMQDQYGLFLQADKEARMNILGSILGLGIYSDMEELAAAKATDANRQLRTLADRIDTIMAGLPDMELLKSSIKATEESKNCCVEEAAKKAAEIDSLKATLNIQQEAADRIIKLNNKITMLTAKKASKETIKTSQIAAIAAANAVLAEETSINAGVEKYNTLLEQEKELIKGKATYDSYKTRKGQVEQEIKQAEAAAEEQKKKKSALTLTKIEPLQQALTHEAELTSKHEEYTATAKRIAEMESLEPEWEDRKTTENAAETELKRIENEYDTAHAKLTIRLENLKDKVKLLENSGCPDVEKASCKFLADALAAKAILPDTEKTIKTLDEKYRADLRKASETLAEARRALGDSLYHPEEITALRSSLRSIEAYEKDYMKLDSKRKELKLFTERTEELENAIAAALADAMSSREELADIEKHLMELEAANTKYDNLTKEIEAAKVWTIKEKQLPAAKEQKRAAEQRIIELNGEIEAVTAEIAEVRSEIEAEKRKTVGLELLQDHVRKAEAEYDAIHDSLQQKLMTLGGLKKQQEQAAEKYRQIAEMQGKTNAIGITAAGYEELKRAFSQDGIPHNIIRSIIPIFEATATNILSQMSQGKMSVEFVTEKLLKSNSKKEVTTLDIIINDTDTGRLPYMSRSGGERVKAALSVILALSEIKSSKAGIQLGFLFIDEPPFLDAPGVQAYCDALEAIQRRYSDLKVMAITHDPAMKSRFPQSVDVVKTPEGSKVIYE
ncbi:MAG: exonuclease subunit SbcD [Ruminococcus sp.]|nr:exonuclease subunit SbcD [Ruminococcus sp.]